MTPIVINRKTHELISAPDLTQDQQNLLWGHLVQAYLDAHPEVLTANDHSTPVQGKESVAE